MPNLKIAAAFFALSVSGVFSAPASAVLLDPATLHIGTGAGTAGAAGAGQHPNLLGSGTHFDIYQNSGGAAPLIDPIDIILAVPNYGAPGSTTTPILPATGTMYAPYPGGSTTTVTISSTDNAYGLSGGPFQGEMTGANDDIYSFLAALNATAHDNFISADNSNNFGNLVGALGASGISTVGLTGFDIYVFQALHGFPDSGNDLLDVSSATLPLGTFIVAFGESTDDKVYATPFTEAGFANRGCVTCNFQEVPEPASLAVLGSAFAMFGILARRRRWI